MDFTKLSDEELILYAKLKREEEVHQRRQSLLDFRTDKNPNYTILTESRAELKYIGEELVHGASIVILEGSSRSGKTFSSIDFIIYLCIHLHAKEGCTIIILRETYAEFKDSLYEDFKRRLDYYELDNPFHRAKEVKSFKIGKSTVKFMGCDNIGRAHGAGSDYLFCNEMMSIEQGVFDQLEQRCRIMVFGDYNPSFTHHWVFDNILKRDDVAFLRTTYKNNPFVSPKEKKKIESYEPWESGSYEVTPEGQVIYNGLEISEKNQPPPHEENVRQGTANTFMWKCYGLGLRGAQEGLIHKNVRWIDEFPNIAYTYCTDFGFTNDPCSVNKYAEDEHNIYIEPLIYRPIPTPEELDDAMLTVGVDPDIPNAADSSDVYMSEHGKIEMVRSLRNLGWEIFKISKTKGNYFWIESMNDKQIHIVKNDLYEQVKIEVENYVWKEVNGIPINQPIDKFDHMWNSCFVGETLVTTDKGLIQIKDLEIGNLALTSKGFKPIVNKFYNGIKETHLFCLQLSTFSLSLRCTKDHKVKTEQGWIEISKLKQGMTVFLTKCLTEKSINFTEVKDISVEATGECTGMSGSFTTEKEKRSTKYTIKTETHTTTDQRIWKRSKVISTYQNTLRKGLKTIQSGLDHLSLKVRKLVRSGTNQQRVKSGIDSMLLTVDSEIMNTENENASNAKKYLRKKPSRQCSVLLNADQNIEEIQGLMTSQKNVSTAEKSGRQINIQKQNVVQKFVLQRIDSSEIRRDKVYDIEVSEEHEYFANGLLVHNCKYGHMSHSKLSQAPETS